MKKITFLLLLAASQFSFAQQVVVQDFETESSFIFAGFEGLEAAIISDDPEVGGSRMKNLKVVSQPGGQIYQGAEIIQQNTRLKLTTDKTVTMDVYSTQAFTLLAKVEVGGAGPNSAASQSYTTPNAWQTLTFTFTQGLDNTGTANGSYKKLVFFPNWKPTNDGFISPPGDFAIYIDNVTSEADPILPDPIPTMAAPLQPNRPAADVKSIFCDVYAPIADFNYLGVDNTPLNDNTYNTSWCGATTTLVQVGGNNTNKITGLGCEGISFLAGRFDAAGFTNFHMDIWTATPTQDKSFNFKFSNWSGGAVETNAFEYSATNANILPNVNPGTWISIDLPFSSFNPIAGSNNSDFVQFVITSDLGTVFYDNVYLHKNTLATSSFVASKIKMYPNPATTNFTIEALENVEQVSVFNMIGQEVISSSPNSKVVTVDVTSLQVGVYVVRTSINGNASSTRFIKE